MQDEDKGNTVSRSCDRIGCTIGRNDPSLGTAEESEDAGAEPREEIFI